jgi:hypothetical protein
MKLMGITGMGFFVTGQLLIRSFPFIRYWRKNGHAVREYIIYS